MSSQIQKLVSKSTRTKALHLTVYLLDLWSFIPYYMAHLCNALRGAGVDARLGSVRYHLDRNYFRSAGSKPDSFLLDFGGGVKANFLRRIVKTAEYLANLFVIGLRLTFSRLDILHVQFLPFLDRGFRFELWFVRWVHSRGIRIVHTVHNLLDRDSREGGKPLFEELYGLVDAIICHGQEAREKLKKDFGVPIEKIWVIPHGPLFVGKPTESKKDCREKLGLPVDETIVLCAGVISEYKGIPFLLDAWKTQVESGAKSRLVIAGTGDAGLLAQIREKVEREGLRSSVTLWLRFIAVEEIPLLHQAADILVYPYKAGTTSGALLTGLNYEKAIITTRLPFFQEHLNEDSEAIMVDYGEVDGMAKALTRLITDPEIRERLSSAVAKRSKTGDPWKNIACATIKCYRGIAQSVDLNRS